MNQVIVGLASDRAQVLVVMAALAEVGIASEQVSVLMSGRRASGALAAEIQATVAHGSFSAGNIGAGLGWLAGMGALAIPGIGLFFAAGPVLGVLAGIAVGRSLGNHRGAMIEELGIPDTAVDHYESEINAGRIILAAHCDDQAVAERVLVAMRRVGMTDVTSAVLAPPPNRAQEKPPAPSGALPSGHP